jgi:hypothetical protein
MKSQSDKNTQHRLLVRELLGSVENALDEFWEAHIEDTEFSEDVLPEVTRNSINEKILERAKCSLSSKRAQDLQKMTGESRFARTLRERMITDYLENAGDGIDDYFERLTL